MPPLVLATTHDAPEHFLEEWPEDGRFYRATQDALPGFTLGYLVAARGGVRTAVVPYFVTDFSLATMLGDGWLKRLLGGVRLRLACVGHPTAAIGRIDGAISAELVDAIYEHLKHEAPLVAFKGFGPALPAQGFVRVAGLPVAVLHAGGEAQRAANHKWRRNFARKQRRGAALRFEECSGLPAQYLDDVHRLYLNTYARAAIRFECLSRAYFAATAAESIYLLAFLGERLVGFAQFLQKGERVVGKYLGLDYTVSRRHGLYFMLYFKALELCARRGVCELEVGEANYAFKQALGCELAESWIYYRHRNPLLHALLARLAFLLEPEPRMLPRRG